MMAFVPLAHAEEVTTPSVSALQTQLQTLLEQVDDLKARLDAMRVEQQSTLEELQQVKEEFRAYLREGVQSGEVERLQQLLAKDRDLYPEGLVTGYYGPMTAKAVARFQKKYGIDSVGVVGPKTRSKLNELYVLRANASASNTDKKVTSSARVKVRDNDDDDSDDGDDDDTSNKDRYQNEYRYRKVFLSGNKAIVCHKPGSSAEQTLTVAMAAASAHIRHGDFLGACDGDVPDNDANDTDDTDDTNGDGVAPVLSGIAHSGITSESVTVSWTTDISANSVVAYNTTLPIGPSAVHVKDDAMVTSHLVTLSGLNPETTYYYVVASEDADGDGATSTARSFTTLAEPDTEAPVISAIKATSTTDTSVVIEWMTNEDADSRVTYSSTLPISTDSAFVSSATLLQDHAITLANLTPETTYYYTVTSNDSDDNGVTSGVHMFSTLATPVDETAPVISGLEATSTASTSIQVVWDTDEESDSVLWYSTVTPVNVGSDDSVSSAVLTTSHDLSVANLNASTTYYYVVTSEDAAGNTATSDEDSVVTLSE
jgi:hypothetical protein